MSPGSQQWHAVTPQTRPLSIAILELAPTSVTLALTRSPPVNPLLCPVPTHASQLGTSSSQHGKKKKKKRTQGDSDEALDDDDDPAAAHAVPGAYPYPSLLAEGQTFKDMLSHGVVVTLDGMPWSRIVAHVSDDTEEAGGDDDEGEWEDEEEEEGANTSCVEQGQAPRRRRRHRASDAGRTRRSKPSAPAPPPPGPPGEKAVPRWDRERAVVVVYDLDPSQEHEIELQIVGLATEVKESLVPVSNTVLIPPATPGATLHPRSRANSLRSRSRPRSRSNSVNTTPAPPVPSPLGNEVPASPNRSGTPTPDQQVVPTSILSPIDAQTAQTRHLIAAAHAEREHLQVQIKEARKTAQRSEAALRTDIEQMKRSNEKAGSNDQRNKQKYLALQEQVKQGWAGAETANKEAEAVKTGMPDIEARLKAVNAEMAGVRVEWNKVKQREEEALEADKQARADEDKKLADLNNKIDKVRARKEKKDSERAELQKKLDELEKQREEVARKTEESKTVRRPGYYPGLRWEQGHEFNPNPNFEGRALSSHPSMSNLPQGQGGGNYPSGPGFRPRGTFHRYPSGGSRPAPPQQSPTVNQTFFPNNPPSPAWPAKGSSTHGSHASHATHGTHGSHANQTRSTPGPNPAAAPFMPSSLANSGPGSGPAPGPGSGPGGAPFDPALHTAFMPPQLQHRIYLPNSVRPRPTPNFHPPPSVLAEQQAQASSSSSSTSSKSSLAPAFPPLPSQAPPAARPPAAGGPSLASIVTRAVLAPTSNALAAGGPGPGVIGAPPPQPAGGRTTPAFRAVKERVEYPPLSPTAPAFHTSSPPRTTPPHTTSPPPWGPVGTPERET